MKCESETGSWKHQRGALREGGVCASMGGEGWPLTEQDCQRGEGRGEGWGMVAWAEWIGGEWAGGERAGGERAGGE